MKLASRFFVIFGLAGGGWKELLQRCQGHDLTDRHSKSMSMSLCVSLPAQSCSFLSQWWASKVCPAECSQGAHFLSNDSWNEAMWSQSNQARIAELEFRAYKILMSATHKNYSHSIRYCGYSTARADLQATVGGSQSHPRARATKWLTPRTSGLFVCLSHQMTLDSLPAPGWQFSEYSSKHCFCCSYRSTWC